MGKSNIEINNKRWDDRLLLNEFIDWLDGNDHRLVKDETKEEHFSPHYSALTTMGIEKLINRFFGIDDAGLEKERQAIYDAISVDNP